MTTDLHGTTFLVTNQSPPTSGFFRGYCFVGNDLIFGASGAELYQSVTGKQIAAAQDGCYATARRIGDTYIFDVDFAGYTILFYYHDGETWVVSNSFAQVVDFLRSQNIKIRPNYAHLAASNGRGMPLGQLFSLQTLVHGVYVAPRSHSLVVTPSKVVFEPRSRGEKNDLHYAQALSKYLNTWVGRFETLVHSEETDFTVDLTGGVDSRVNFGLLQAAQKRLGGTGIPPRLRCTSSPNNRTDLEVATAVAQHYGMSMNDDRPMRRIPLLGEESYDAYRNLTMGVYYPFYRPTQAPALTNITIGGGGGGIHRKTYEVIVGSADPEVFFSQYARNLKRAEYETEFIEDGRHFLRTVLTEGEDALRVLLREGRVRYHSGRTPRLEIAFTPLHSVAAEIAQDVAGEERLEQGQLNYDIMHSVDPDLAMMAYDEVAKSPTPDVVKRLTSAHINADASPGHVWTSTEDVISSPAHDGKRPIDAYKQAFDQALDNPFVRKFWGKAMLQDARALMRNLDAGKSIGNAANGTPISAILSADLITPN